MTKLAAGRKWRRLLFTTFCGRCGRLCEKDEPVLEIRFAHITRALTRCSGCAVELGDTVPKPENADESANALRS